MRYKTVTQRIGERLGDIDWNYDFNQHAWSSSSGGHNPELISQELKRMEAALKAGKRVWVRMYETEEPVHEVGMYDGWPYWSPHPSFNSSSWLGSSWHSFMDIREIRIEP